MLWLQSQEVKMDKAGWKKFKERVKTNPRFKNYQENGAIEIEFDLEEFSPLDMDMFRMHVRAIFMEVPKNLRDNADFVEAFDGKINFQKRVKPKCPHCHKEIPGEDKWVNAARDMQRLQHSQKWLTLQ